MWLLAVAIYFGCKWLTWRRASVKGVPIWRHVAYLFAWPGMNAEQFLNPRLQSGGLQPPRWEWLEGAANMLAGIVLILFAARLAPSEQPLLVGWMGLVGFALMLHFGAFRLLSCFWRSVGIDAAPLMNQPTSSVSVSEFWGRRWNTAFRDLAHRFLFRPLSRRLGPRWAVFAGFVFSGLVHDLVISLPTGGGYGGPTFFFLVQSLGMFAERSSTGRKLGLERCWRGWLFTAIVVLGPAPLLFHPPFLDRIVVPFLEDTGLK